MAHSGPFVRGIYLTLHACLGSWREHGAAGTARRLVSATRTRAGRSCACSTRPPELTHAVGTNYALMHAAESATVARSR